MFSVLINHIMILKIIVYQYRSHVQSKLVHCSGPGGHRPRARQQEERRRREAEAAHAEVCNNIHSILDLSFQYFIT